MYLFFIYHLVPAAAACVRHPAAACCTPLLFIICLLFNACSGSVRQASCWSCHYCLFIYLFIMKYLQLQHAFGILP
jgi:hypothetical protein